uniref:Uncharacterized protein LOC111112874 isoform X2 n=1 Tax=Crassostrea virginica TaxID=6565 RepID=A0A8B8BU55_CRAVI|nr:uncharacterized protein LOC111112874 isoform X2 [Crassostrea virginica]
MYETESKQSASKDVFWSKFEPETKNDRDAIVPGVTAPGNRRPRKPGKMKSSQVKSGRKTAEVKATIPVKSPVKVMNLSADTTTITQDLTDSLVDTQPKKFLSGGKKVSLKDLCAEDKKRVANLIKELAKMGDEKEAVLGQLQTERREYEKQVIRMVSQQEQILIEREDIQSKLFQCQELLSRYKNQLLEREDQLNTSITEMVNQKESRRGRSGSVEEIYDSRHKAGHRQTDNKENQTKGVRELPQKDRPRRPFTSMIDKEIAQRKQTEDPGGLSTIMASESSTTTPPRHRGGGGRVDYCDRIPVIKAFRDPVMSSTQKSNDIRAYVDTDDDKDSPRDEFRRLEPDTSPRSSRASFPTSSPKGQRSSSPVGQQGKGNNKVGFKDKLTVDNDELQKHSPQSGNGANGVGNREFQQRYKKLSSTERKQELLRQRETLLEEQNRLRKILIEQEAQLKRKQDLIQERRMTQQARMDYLERNGEFPDRGEDAGSVFSVPDNGSVLDGRIDRLNLERCWSEEDVRSLGSDKEEFQPGIGNKVTKKHEPLQEMKTNSDSKEKLTRATSPIKMESGDDDGALSTPQLIDAATSYSRRLDHSMEEEEVEEALLNTPTRKMDAATSYSRRSPCSPVLDLDVMELPRQNNLPLQTNRQRASKSPVQRLPTKPGEKTLSVVEIVNSLEEERTPLPSNPRSTLQRDTTPTRTGSQTVKGVQRDITPVRGRSITVGGTAKILSSGGGGGVRPPTGNVFAVPQAKNQFCEELAEETAEESSLLEDIFFL